MTPLPEPLEIAQADGVDAARFHEDIRPAGRPVVLRGLVADWPAVAAGRQGLEPMIAYLGQWPTAAPIATLHAPPEADGRFFYNAQMTGFNFETRAGTLPAFLAELRARADDPAPPGLAVQSEAIARLLPAFAAENRLTLLPDVAPRIWIGNRIRVVPHFDLMENLACNVAGRRRFTLFPPEQLPNLYPGPFELTPAGTPVSMVDMAAPDLARYPAYATAWRHALRATLEPGDALYIPYGWWHGVDSLDPLSILVNYWWSDAPQGVGGAYDALLHAILAYRHLPEPQRGFWRMMTDHYVFEADGDPGAHLPPHARGIMAQGSPPLFARMRAMLRKALG